MSDDWQSAFGRALAHACAQGVKELLPSLLPRISWEVRHLVQPQFGGLAIVVKLGDGRVVVGREEDALGLPAESLMGLLAEPGGAQLSYRVRDHALDGIRFLSDQCRSSIVVRLQLPESVQRGGEAAIWLGLVCAAAPVHVEEARALGQALEGWFSVYAPVMARLEDSEREREGSVRRLREASSLAHDARAPLGAMRRLLEAQAGARSPMGGDDARFFVDQFEYLETLLSRCSPQALSREAESGGRAGLARVVERVVARFAGSAAQAGISLRAELEPAPLECCMPEVELERVLSNVVGNAVQHSGQGEVLIKGWRVPGTRQIAVSVRDNGPGFTDEALSQLKERDSEGVVSDSGWGMGLISSRRRIELSGGSIRIGRHERGGGAVEIAIPEAAGVALYAIEGCSGASLCGPSSEFGRVALHVVDDDAGHAQSVVRLLCARGIVARAYASLADFFASGDAGTGPVLCDARMPGGGAEDLLQQLRRRRCSPRAAVMSGESSDEQLYRLAALGAERFFLKPFDVGDVVAWLRGEQTRAL